MRIVLWPTVGGAEIGARVRAIEGVDLIEVSSREELLEQLDAAEVLMLPSPLYDADMAAAVRTRARQLRWIQLLSAGYEEVLAHGVPPRVVVSNAGDAWSPAVAEHAMTLLLALVRHLPEIFANQAHHSWDGSVVTRMGTLEGCTLLVAGFGSIGREVAVRARAFGMRVVGVSRSGRADALADECYPEGELDTLLPQADVLVLALPFSERTRGLIAAARLAAMKPSALLINVARGGVVDTHALAQALKQGTIAGAGIDVTDPEPLPPEHPLWNCPNLLISPHVAGASGKTGKERLASMAARNTQRYLAGETPAHVLKL
ncbi:MAG TPA: D-2-hydroxyacid dehydrogenase [Gammaproteobacteria bacterium]|nr:D-2-hydroxyacid dehydrogenase [Gammaproteobacteria bacterium]